MEIDPFGGAVTEKEEKLFKKFGISRFKPLVKKLKNPLPTMKRGFIFGHRNFDKIIKRMRKNKPFAVMSGIKPTNYLHLGSKMVIDELAYLQKHGGEVYYSIADVEAYLDNGLPFEKSKKIAEDNITDLLALGIDLKKAKIYRQSTEPLVQKFGYIFSDNVTKNMMNAIYGDKELKLYLSALLQVADILLPQIEKGKLPTVVPVGIDQDPHIRLTRDIARKHNFLLPSSIYHRHLSALTGDKKMSKRNPKGLIYLREDPEKAAKKIKSAVTGGKKDTKKQRKLGGDPTVCKIYELYSAGFIKNDKKLEEIHEKCKSGKLLCGEDKEHCAEIIKDFLRKHQEKRKKYRDKAREIIEEIS